MAPFPAVAHSSRRGAVTYRVISDQLGSPRYVVHVNDSSDVPYRADYSAFGEATGTGLTWMPFGFAGGFHDPDTGLVRFGARDYDPSVGSWTSKEPKRFRAPGGNLYAYALGDPLNLQDVSGLDVCVYRSSQGYRHEWVEIGGDPARSYGFWPYDGIFGGRSNLQSPDASHLSERFSSETELTCHPASSAEELELERWIQKTYDVNQASERNPYFLGISDCTTFTAGAVEELKRIQRDPWQIASDIFWGLW